MNYKVGDKVQIRADLHESMDWCGSGRAVVAAMKKYAGGWVTITKKVGEKLYTIAADGGEWLWHESMIQGKVIPIRVGVSEGKVDIKTEGNSQKEVAEMLGCEPKEVPQDDDYAIEGKPTLVNDPVSNPSHYTGHGRIQPIKFIQDKGLNFARGNVVKYVTRAGHKPEGDKKQELEDLRKARQYLDFEINHLEGRV